GQTSGIVCSNIQFDKESVLAWFARYGAGMNRGEIKRLSCKTGKGLHESARHISKRKDKDRTIVAGERRTDPTFRKQESCPRSCGRPTVEIQNFQTVNARPRQR